MTLPDLSDLGLETTDEEVKTTQGWRRSDEKLCDCLECRLLRDHSCLTTALSEARVNATQREAMIRAERDEWDSREAAAREEEREACALLIEHSGVFTHAVDRRDVAAEIRARSAPTGTGGNDSDRSRHFPLRD